MTTIYVLGRAVDLKYDMNFFLKYVHAARSERIHAQGTRNE